MKAVQIALDTEISIGADWGDCGLQFEQPDNTLLGLTGWQFQSQIRHEDDSLAATVQVVFEAPHTLMLQLPRAVTATLQVGDVHWDLLAQSPADKRYRWVWAVIPIKRGPTRWQT